MRPQEPRERVVVFGQKETAKRFAAGKAAKVPVDLPRSGVCPSNVSVRAAPVERCAQLVDPDGEVNEFVPVLKRDRAASKAEDPTEKFRERDSPVDAEPFFEVDVVRSVERASDEFVELGLSDHRMFFGQPQRRISADVHSSIGVHQRI